ncbi:energy-coupling factor transporter ATPase [Bifidobacterium aquikefiricola]|uniref:Energy-coupling factor transporter ATPase n=1 Tax=Bifidobacterium aquikefiricola TaxID=3059038 RepID=A0AB39U4R7_9BIFI
MIHTDTPAAPAVSPAISPSKAVDASAQTDDADQVNQTVSGSHVKPAKNVRLNDVRFSYDHGKSWALDGISLDIHEGEYICILGANGSGKSTLGRILAGFVSPDAGQVNLMGQQVFSGTQADEQAYRQARQHIGMVFQNPEDQIVTTVVQDDVAFGPENLGVPHDHIATRVHQALEQVDMLDFALADPSRLSGGQQQRVAIAGALAMHPGMLILDEPVAMLDDAGRQEVSGIIQRLRDEKTTIINITHMFDTARTADRLIVLDHGTIAYDGRPHGFLNNSALVDAHGLEDIRKHDIDAQTLTKFAGSYDISDNIADDIGKERKQTLAIHHVTFQFSDAHRPALNDVSFSAHQGEIVAIVGRNGSGKSTLARLICALAKPESGSIEVNGINAYGARGKQGRKLRKSLRACVGYVMQHPERQLFADTVAADVAYGPHNLGCSDEQTRQRVDDTLEFLGIAAYADRSPFALSGGQQRLAAIAGVIASRPTVLVLDEPTAGLDARARSRMYTLIAQLKAQGTTIIMTTHSHDEAELLSDKVALLHHGSLLAFGKPKDVLPMYDEITDSALNLHVRSDQPRHGFNPSERSPIAKKSSLIHLLDPRIKMISALAMMFTAFAIHSLWQLGLAAVVVFGIVAMSRLGFRHVLHTVKVLLTMLIIMGILNLLVTRSGTVLFQWGALMVTDAGIMSAVLYSCRFALVVMLGAVVLQTTTPTEMTDSMESLLSPLKRFGFHVQELSLVMSLALRFIPTLTREARQIIDAQAARGGSVETGGPVQRVKALSSIVVPVFAGALRHADNVSLALDARCYEGGSGRTHFRMLSTDAKDYCFLAGSVLYIALLLAIPTII